MELNTLIITQARMGSSRLPGKIFKEINGKTLLEIHTNRLKKARSANAVLVATTDKADDKQVYDLATRLGLLSYRGSESDVLDRFYQAAKELQPQWVVRVTSDCPLVDPALIDSVIAMAKETGVDYCSNILVENFPDGQDIEVFTFRALERSWNEATLPSEREHVTPYMRNNISGKGKSIFSAKNFDCENDYSKIRMTVDEEADFLMMQKLISEMGTERTWKEYVDFMIKSGLDSYNSDIMRNQGYYKSLENDR
ncbi:MAG: glycosyltransferase family protein [Chitinophagaceae bacterium]|nr:glycosyltransferase family protein [Chitinophagaceae bacterium]